MTSCWPAPAPSRSGPRAGRPRAGEVDAGLVPALSRLVDPATRGDPESPLRWTTKSTEKLAGELASAGHAVSADTVGRLLKEDGYSLQGNAKTVEGRQHPDRDGQFRLINEQVRAFQAAGEPVISVDTKKKELVGNYKNGGKEWHPRGEPERVEGHDFKGELGRAVPYGVYDIPANAGCGRLQRQPAAAAEGGAGQARARARPGDQRVPLPAGDLEMEPDRAPALCPDLHELARQAADQPRSHRRDNRRDRHQDRADRPGRAGHRHLREGHQDLRQGDEGPRAT